MSRHHLKRARWCFRKKFLLLMEMHKRESIRNNLESIRKNHNYKQLHIQRMNKFQDDCFFFTFFYRKELNVNFLVF